MIIDAKDLIVGRMVSIVTKKAILGEEIFIVNSEKAVFTGSKDYIFQKYKAQADRGEPFHGPFLPKTPDRFLKRIIRGMLTYKKGKGKEAFKRIKCFRGIPKEFEGKTISLEKVNVAKIRYTKYVTIGEVCNHLKQR